MYFSFPLCQFSYNPYFVSDFSFQRKKRRMFLLLIPLLHKLDKAAFNLRHIVLLGFGTRLQRARHRSGIGAHHM